MEMLIKDPSKLLDDAVRYNAHKLYKDAQQRHVDLETYYEKGTLLDKLDRPIANYCAYISDVAVGYFLGKPVRYTVAKEYKKQLEKVQSVLDENDEHDHNKTLGIDQSVHGRSYELLYMNEDAKIKFTDIKPWEVVLVFDTTAAKNKIGAFRFVRQKDYTTQQAIEKTHCFFYDKTRSIEYEVEGDTFTELSNTEHYFGEVPVIEYASNNNLIGDFERVVPLINAYNDSQTMTKIDMENFTNALLLIIGQMGTTTKDLNQIKEEGIAMLGAGGDARWLVKEINDQFIENYKNRLRKDIHTISKTPDLTDEKFGGQQTGVAMEFKLWGLEQLTSTKESKFKAGLKERLRLIIHILQIKGEQFDPDEIEIQFTRNIPANLLEISQNIVSLKGLVSDETLLSQVPFVQDPAAEIEKNEAAREKLMDHYNFGPSPRSAHNTKPQDKQDAEQDDA